MWSFIGACPVLSAEVSRGLFLGCSLYVILYHNLQQGKFNQTGKTKSQILLSYFLMIQSRDSSLTCGNCSTPAALQINGGAKSNTPFQKTTPTFAIAFIFFPIFMYYFCIDVVQTSPHYAILTFSQPLATSLNSALSFLKSQKQMVWELKPNNFACWVIFHDFALVCWLFFKINFFQKFFHKHYQSVKQ